MAEIVGDATEGSLSPEVQAQQVDEKARIKGWKPLSEWKGDASEWVEAREFLGRERLYDKIHDLKDQLHRQSKKFETDLNQISTHFLQVKEVEYKRALAELAAQKKVAKEERDVDEVERISTEISNVEKERADAKATAEAQKRQQANAEPTQTYKEWTQRNEWFNQDTDMTKEAIAIGTGHAAANPGKSQSEVLEYVTDRIKKIYPEKFTKKVAQEQQHQSVETGGHTKESTGGGSRRTKLSDVETTLNDTERSIMNTILKRHTLKDVAEKNKRSEKEEYLTQVAVAKGLPV